MSRNLVTLEDARMQLRRDLDDTGPDPDLEAKIAGASAAVLRYLKSAADAFLDDDGNVVVSLIPDDVRSATLILIGYLDNVRDEDSDDSFDAARLPKPVRALLYPLRLPTLA